MHAASSLIVTNSSSGPMLMIWPPHARLERQLLQRPMSSEMKLKQRFWLPSP